MRRTLFFLFQVRRMATDFLAISFHCGMIIIFVEVVERKILPGKIKSRWKKGVRNCFVMESISTL